MGNLTIRSCKAKLIPSISLFPLPGLSIPTFQFVILFLLVKESQVNLSYLLTDSRSICQQSNTPTARRYADVRDRGPASAAVSAAKTR